MKIALISDIHGNLVAFEAVLADLAGDGVEQIVSLGDVATFGPQPCEVIARLKQLGCLCVMGNHDHELVDPSTVETHVPQVVIDWQVWCAAQLGAAELSYLRSFSPTLDIALGDRAMLCYHGSPRATTELILPTTSSADLAAIFADHPATILAGGHTHIQMLRRVADRLLINAGSVGWPLEQMPFPDRPRFMPWAEYALISLTGSRLNVELRQVPVDLDGFARAALASSMPHAQFWANQWPR